MPARDGSSEDKIRIFLDSRGTLRDICADSFRSDERAHRSSSPSRKRKKQGLSIAFGFKENNGPSKLKPATRSSFRLESKALQLSSRRGRCRKYLPVNEVTCFLIRESSRQPTGQVEQRLNKVQHPKVLPALLKLPCRRGNVTTTCSYAETHTPTSFAHPDAPCARSEGVVSQAAPKERSMPL